MVYLLNCFFTHIHPLACRCAHAWESTHTHTHNSQQHQKEILAWADEVKPRDIWLIKLETFLVHPISSSFAFSGAAQQMHQGQTFFGLAVSVWSHTWWKPGLCFSMDNWRKQVGQLEGRISNWTASRGKKRRDWGSPARYSRSFCKTLDVHAETPRHCLKVGRSLLDHAKGPPSLASCVLQWSRSCPQAGEKGCCSSPVTDIQKHSSNHPLFQYA